MFQLSRLVAVSRVTVPEPVAVSWCDGDSWLPSRLTTKPICVPARRSDVTRSIPRDRPATAVERVIDSPPLRRLRQMSRAGPGLAGNCGRCGKNASTMIDMNFDDGGKTAAGRRHLMDRPAGRARQGP